MNNRHFFAIWVIAACALGSIAHGQDEISAERQKQIDAFFELLPRDPVNFKIVENDPTLQEAFKAKWLERIDTDH